MDYMRELTGKSEQEIYSELKGVIYLNPLHEGNPHFEDKYLIADEYLSGNVRENLKLHELRRLISLNILSMFRLLKRCSLSL